MHVREQLEQLARFKSDSLLPEQLPAVKLPKVAAFFQECGDDVLVLLGEQAAGGVDQPPAGFYQVRRRAQARPRHRALRRLLFAWGVVLQSMRPELRADTCVITAR